MANPRPFEGKVILITGAARGIGEATARYLAVRGATLSLCDVLEEELQKVVEAYQTEFPGIRIHSEVVDISDESAVSGWVSGTKEKFGQIDGCVNNAAIGPRNPLVPLHMVKAEDFRHVLDVNVTGTFLCIKHELAHIRNGGSIVNMSSIAGTSGGLLLGPYFASKHAIVGLTRHAAVENAERGIRINAVCPGFTEGETWNEVKEGISNVIGQPYSPQALTQLFKRLAKPEEVAALVAYLLGDESTFITKSIYNIDGGWPGR